MSTRCVCDSIYGTAGSKCEPATDYLCKAATQSPASPAFYQMGQAVDLPIAIQKAAVLLRDAKYPLFKGIERLGIKAQQAVVDLCRSVNGVVDTCAFNSGRSAASLSLAREGKIEATMGEVIKRSKAILAIDCDPFKNHSRFTKQLESRPWYWIGTTKPTMLDAKWICLDQSDLDNLLVGVQAFLENKPLGSPIDAIAFESSCGADSVISVLKEWGKQFSAIDHITVLHDSNSEEPEFDIQCDLVTAIVRALNEHSHVVSMDLASHFNCIGAKCVLAWSSGFPQAVDFSKGLATSFGLEFSSENIVRRKECDLVFEFTNTNVKSVGNEIQSILVTGGDCVKTANSADVAFCGIESIEDTFMRFDGTSFDLTRKKAAGFSTVEIVEEIQAALKST